MELMVYLIWQPNDLFVGGLSSMDNEGWSQRSNMSWSETTKARSSGCG